MLHRFWRRLFRPHVRELRLLISDVDGTLVAGSEHLPASTAKLLRELAQCGFHLAFASARPYPSLAELARRAELPAWIISLDGALLHAPDGSLHFAATFPQELLQALLELASHYSVHYAVFTPEGIVHTTAVHIPSYLDDPALARQHGRLIADFLQQPAVLFCLSGSQHHSLGFVRAVEKLPARLRRRVTIAVVESVSHPGTTLVEIRLREAHKGTAARALQQRLGLPRRACLAIGDYRNDLPLFAVCGFRVAMADAVAELRSQADWVTSRPATEHGIDEVLLRLLHREELLRR